MGKENNTITRTGTRHVGNISWPVSNAGNGAGGSEVMVKCGGIGLLLLLWGVVDVSLLIE